jgi:hypothetical protein
MIKEEKQQVGSHEEQLTVEVWNFSLLLFVSSFPKSLCIMYDQDIMSLSLSTSSVLDL